MSSYISIGAIEKQFLDWYNYLKNVSENIMTSAKKNNIDSWGKNYLNKSRIINELKKKFYLYPDNEIYYLKLRVLNELKTRFQDEETFSWDLLE